MGIRTVASLVVGCVAALGSSQQASAQQAPTRSIDNVTEDLYRATNNAHRTVFLVTDVWRAMNVQGAYEQLAQQ